MKTVIKRGLASSVQSEKRRHKVALIAGRVPEVTPEEKHHLAECCAFFKAEHYRGAAPGEVRQQDVECAEADIEAVIRKTRER
jgi:hypothetical protein